MEAPHEFTQIMFPLKALKLLINDLRSSGETGRGLPHSGVVEADSEDGVSSHPLFRSHIANGLPG